MQLPLQRITFQYQKRISGLENTVGNLYCFTEMKHGTKKTLIPHLMLRWRAMMVQNSESLLEYIYNLS